MLANDFIEELLILLKDKEVQFMAGEFRIQTPLFFRFLVKPIQHKAKLAHLLCIVSKTLIQSIHIREFVVLLKLSRKNVFDHQRIAFSKHVDLSRLSKMFLRVESICQSLVNGLERTRLPQDLRLSYRKQIDHHNSHGLSVSDLFRSQLDLTFLVWLDVEDRILSSAKEIKIRKADVL